MRRGLTLCLPVLLSVTLLAAACGKDVIEEKAGPPVPTVVTFTAPVISHLDITTDGGVAVNSKDPAQYRPCTVKVSGEEKDYAMEGRGHTYFESYRTLIFGSDPYYRTGAYGSTPSDFFCCMFGMPEFVRLIRQLWIDNQASLLSGLLDCLAETETLIGTAAQADMDRWGIDRYVHAEEYRKLRAWLTNRFRYLDGVIRNYPIHP